MNATVGELIQTALSKPSPAAPGKKVPARKWRKQLAHLPPAQREAFLQTDAALSALGAEIRYRLLKEVQAERRTLESSACSGAWIDAVNRDGAAFPVPGMKLSRAETSFGDARPHRRWTPPQCVELEDRLDEMGEKEAILHQYPPSPSVLAIEQIRAAQLKPRGGRWQRQRTK
jgi:hypothetical protein